MSNAQIEIQLIASLVAIACAIPGTFLVLRKMAMISDAISHSILPGIVLGFFIWARKLKLLKAKKRSMMYALITPNAMNAHTKRIIYSDRSIT